MRQISKDITLMIDGSMLNFRLTKNDCSSFLNYSIICLESNSLFDEFIQAVKPMNGGEKG